MKKFLSWAAPALMVSMLFVGCQKSLESVSEDGLREGTNMRNGAPACEANGCIDEPYVISTPVLGGGNPIVQIGDIKIWNDNEKVYISGGTYAFENVKIVALQAANAATPANSVFNQAANLAASATNTFSKSYDLPADWGKCTERRFFVKVEGKAGGTETYTINYTRYEICVGCDESFSYVHETELSPPFDGPNVYTFSYTPSETIEDATLIFTFAQGAVVLGLNGWTTNGATRQLSKQTLNACQTYNWTVSLTPNCSGNSGQSNIWTDFKIATLQLVEVEGVEVEQVVEVSKKNDLTPNIQVICP